MEKDPNEIGALWKKTSAKGLEFMSGYVEIDGVRTEVVCFENKSSNEKAPAYKVLKSKPRESQQQLPQPPKQQTSYNPDDDPALNDVLPEIDASVPDDEIDIKDIPF